MKRRKCKVHDCQRLFVPKRKAGRKQLYCCTACASRDRQRRRSMRLRRLQQAA